MYMSVCIYIHTHIPAKFDAQLLVLVAAACEGTFQNNFKH